MSLHRGGTGSVRLGLQQHGKEPVRRERNARLI
jgi:hypothetical protein